MHYFVVVVSVHELLRVVTSNKEHKQKNKRVNYNIIKFDSRRLTYLKSVKNKKKLYNYTSLLELIFLIYYHKYVIFLTLEKCTHDTRD